MINTISIAGALLALLAYFMITTGRWKATDTIYHVVNLVSCLVLGGIAVYTGTAGYILLNVVWGAVAVHTLVKKFQDSRHGRLNEAQLSA